MNGVSLKLDRLLAPQSIVVVGGSAAAMVIEQCRRIGFSGELYAIHPSLDTLNDVACFRSLDELPSVPDACFLGVSPELSINYVANLSQMKSGGVVCYASGFAESGEVGTALQERLVRHAGGLPLMGPNCHGFVNFLDGVALWPDHVGGGRVERGPALIMQSGNIGINVTFQQRELAPSYVIAMGNNAQLGLHHYIHSLLDDDRVTAIGLHIEGITDVAGFSEAALRALRQNVPLVALKAGSSELGAQMALSHTRSLSSPDNLVTLLFERYGVARCRTLPEFLETLKFLSVGGAIVDRTQENAMSGCEGLSARVVSMSCSGGEASHLADLVNLVDAQLPYRITFPTLSPQTTLAVSKVLGARVHVSNPLDYHTYAWGDLEVLTKAFTALLRDSFHCAMLVLDYPPPERYDVTLWQVAEEALCAASRETGTRVVVVSSLPENFPSSARARLLRQGIAPMQGMMECVQAIAHAHAMGRASGRSTGLCHRKSIERVLGAADLLSEYEAKQALNDYGLSIPDSLTLDSHVVAQFAQEIESKIGYPLVLKAVGKDFTHKTESNGVRLNIASRTALVEQARELSVLSDTLLVESMINGAVAELLVGVRYESGFGLILTLGAGGVLVELINDSVEVLLPACRDELRAAVMSLKIGRLISGYRNRPVGDLEAALDAIEVIVQYATAHTDRLVELDVNPLLILPVSAGDGCDETRSDASVGGAIAVDALISLLTPR